VNAPLPLRMLEKLELHMYRSARQVVCVTRSFVRNLEGRGIEGGKLAFVPNGVEPGHWNGGDGERVRRELGVGASEVVVSYIGTVGMAHGVGTVIEAARRVAESGLPVRFLVVGDGAELDELRRRASEQGAGNVTFTGLVPRERVRDYMAATDVALVLLRRSELFRTVLPSKMFEAMDAGKPIVLGVEGEAREVLESAGAGLPVTPEDAIEVAEAVLRLAADPALRAQMGRAGAEFVAREYDRRAWGAQLLSILETTGSRTAALRAGV
jgi:glycosyltransferase involved in cell wall biosynthesis